MNNIILDIQHIRKTFSSTFINLGGQKDSEVFYVLDDVNMKVEEGKVSALIGGNGSGKSTLFNIIGNFTVPNTGKIIYQGNGVNSNLLNTPSHKLSLMGIGRMFQGTHIFKDMTLLENIILGDNNFFGEIPYVSLLFSSKNKRIEKAKKEKAEQIVSELLGEDSDLWKKKEHLAGSLSYGQQRIVTLIRLLMNDNLKLLLLDEPAAGVNQDVIAIFAKIIHRLTKKEGKSVLLIEHRLDFVKEVADTCFYLENGKICYQGDPKEVLGFKNVRENYIGLGGTI